MRAFITQENKMQQELQNQVTQLKAQLFDASAEMQQMHARSEDQHAALGEIVQLVGLKPRDEQGTIMLADIVEAVRALVTAAKTEETELEPAEAE